jgi:hypothetical protein
MSYVHKAKVYRAHRLNPIPFRDRAKAPAFEEGEIQGYRGRRATDAELERLFADDNLNIGVLTGHGHVVLDIDGTEGCHSIKGLPMPDTPIVLTGADGDESHFHAHFRTNERLRTKIRPLPGIDILGEDWQVLMPESTHPSGHRYRFAPSRALADIDMANVPSWMRELCLHPESQDNDVLPLGMELVSKRESLLEYGCARVAMDMPGGLLESLLAPCTFPTSSAALGGWPELLRREDVNLRCVGYLGLLSAAIGKKFVCPMPGHPQDHKAASLYWDVHGKNATGMLKLRDWHYATGDYTYNQADIFASRNYGDAIQLKGAAEITTWQLRLLLASGVLLPYPVKARSLPLGVPRHIKQVYSNFLDLFRCKWLHTPGEAAPFAWKFARAWCGMRSAAQVMNAMQWLLRHGYIRQAGTFQPKRGRKMTLFLPGEV